MNGDIIVKGHTTVLGTEHRHDWLTHIIAFENAKVIEALPMHLKSNWSELRKTVVKFQLLGAIPTYAEARRQTEVEQELPNPGLESQLNLVRSIKRTEKHLKKRGGVGTSIAGGLRASIKTQQLTLNAKLDEYNAIQVEAGRATTNAEDLFHIVKEETDQKNQYWTTLEEHFFLLQEVRFFHDFAMQGIQYWEAKQTKYHSDLLQNLARDKATRVRRTEAVLSDIRRDMNQFALGNPTFSAHVGEVATFFDDIISRQQAARSQLVPAVRV